MVAGRKMRFAVSESWLPADMQSMVWHYSFVTPSAEVMKGVSIQDITYRNRCLPRKRLETKDGVHAKIAMGVCIVNPCGQCDMAEEGIGYYCGTCRSRPVVMKSFYRESYLGGSTPRIRDASPRSNYVNSLRRQTCPRCERTYRHNRFVADFIEDEGYCPNCADF